MLRRRNWRVLLITAATIAGAYAIFERAWQPFVILLQPDPLQALWLLAVLQSTGILVYAVTTVFGGRLADKVGRRGPLTLTLFLDIVEWCALAITPFWAWLLPINLGYNFSQGTGDPAWDAAVADNTTEKRRASAFSGVLALFTAVSLAWRALFVFLVGVLGLRLVFVVCALLAALSTAFISRLHDRPVNTVRDTLQPKRESFVRTTKGVLSSNGRYYLMIGLAGLTFSVGFALKDALLVAFLALTPELVYLAYVFYDLMAVAQYPLARVGDRFGTKWLLATGSIAGLLALPGFLLATNFLVLLPALLLLGLAQTLFDSAPHAYISLRVRSSQLAHAQGLRIALFSAASAVGPFIAVAAVSVFGYIGPFLAAIPPMGACFAASLALPVTTAHKANAAPRTSPTSRRNSLRRDSSSRIGTDLARPMARQLGAD